MNKKDTYCSTCSKDFATRKDLTDHNACMRKQGKHIGHEVTGKSIAGSQKNSVIDTKEKKEKDFDGFDLPMARFTQQLSTDDNFGLISLEEQEIVEPEFKTPVKRVIQPNPNKSATTSSSHTPLEKAQSMYNSTQGWKDATETIQQLAFDCLPRIDEDYGMSFLIQCAVLEPECSQYQDEYFVRALAEVIRIIGLKKLPLSVAELYHSFFCQYQPVELHKDKEHLGYLFKLAEKIKADLGWLKLADNAWLVVIDYDNFISYSGFQDVLELFMGFKQLYSWPYIVFMRTQLCDAGLHRLPTTETFLNILKLTKFNPSDLSKLFDQFYSLKVGDNKQIYATALDIMKQKQTLYMEELLSAISVIPKQKQVQKLKEDQEEKKMKWELEQGRQQQIQKEKEEQEQKQQQIKLNEQIKIEEAAKQTVLTNTYHKLCTANSVVNLDDLAFLKFVEHIKVISAELPTPIDPRPEQLALMSILLNSTKQLTLIELATGTGKSIMLALIAQYLNRILGKKVLVLVPSEVLRLDQTRCYCPNYCKAEAQLYESIDSAIYYSTFEDVLATGIVPVETIILIDEFHDFMRLPAIIIQNKISCPFLFTSQQQVFGLSATFGGEQVKTDIGKLFPGSIFINVPQQATSRKLDFTVVGRMKESEINQKAIIIAKHEAKNMPVIIFSNEVKEISALIPEAIVFDGEAGEQLSMLTAFRTQPTNPNYIVITTGDAILGLTLFNRAYIVFTSTPNSLSELKQMAGRGEREDVNRAIKGTMLTTKFYVTMQDFESAVVGAEGKQRSLQLDYHKSILYLQKCKPTTPAQTNALNLATAALNDRKNYAQIVSILAKTAFKSIAPVLKSEFAIPDSILGKRTADVQSQKKTGALDSLFSKMKLKKTQENQMVEEAKTAEGCLASHHLEQRKGEDDKNCSMCGCSLMKGLLNCSVCDFEFCNPCHHKSLKQSVDSKVAEQTFDSENDEMISVDMQEKSVLNQEYLQEKEYQEFVRLQEKFQQQHDATSPRSATSSQLLGLPPVTQQNDSSSDGDSAAAPKSTTSSNCKKRKMKQQEKQEQMEEKGSVLSDGSKISKNTKGGKQEKLASWTEKCSWILTGEVDSQFRKFYRCFCGKVSRIRQDNRKQHENKQ